MKNSLTLIFWLYFLLVLNGLWKYFGKLLPPNLEVKREQGIIVQIVGTPFFDPLGKFNAYSFLLFLNIAPR